MVFFCFVLLKVVFLGVLVVVVVYVSYDLDDVIDWGILLIFLLYYGFGGRFRLIEEFGVGWSFLNI